MTKTRSGTSVEAGRSHAGRGQGLGGAQFALLAALFGVLYYTNAYVCDDAFITFRTVDNFVRGHGLRWNVEERVQTFTSPLHTLLLSLAYWPVHDRGGPPAPGRIYWLSILISFAVSLAALLELARRRRGDAWLWPVLALLLSSQAFVTFTSSGLEVPLAYLLLVLFYTRFLWRETPESPRESGVLLGLAGLAVLNRLDALLLFLPACIWLLARDWRSRRWRALSPPLLGLAPLLLWLAFSLVYYGFLLPNTYYSKVGLEVDSGVLPRMGLAYLRLAFLQDPVTPAVIAAGLLAAKLDRRAALCAAAIVLHVGYVFAIGGDFLGFRFLAPPFLLACLLILRIAEARWARSAAPRLAPLACAGIVLYAALLPGSPLRVFRDGPRAADVAFYFPASALSRWRPGASFPFDRFLYVRDAEHCRALRAEGFQVAVWGDGLNGFCRGPGSHLIDPHGITDPLLARLTRRVTGPFRPGHLAKPVPEGYVESILASESRLTDPALSAYYRKLRSVVSGPLFTRERWRHILELNLTSARRYGAPYTALASLPAWMRDEAGSR